MRLVTLTDAHIFGLRAAYGREARMVALPALNHPQAPFSLRRGFQIWTLDLPVHDTSRHFTPLDAGSQRPLAVHMYC